LAHDIAKATKLPLKVWNPPVKGTTTPNSPTRSLRLFLPTKEGGVDETGRAADFTRARLPFASVAANLAPLHFDSLPSFAMNLLFGLAQDLANKYDLQVRDMLLRGKYEEVVRRHERLQRFTRNEGLTGLLTDQTFLTEARKWHEDALEAE